MILALAAALALATWAVSPPRRYATAAVTDFSLAAATHDLAIVARRPHVLGSPDDARVRAWLVARMRALGLATRIQPFVPSAGGRTILGNWVNRPIGDVRGANVIGLIAGQDRTAPALLLMAHHDTVWGSAGAADDGFGVVTLLDTARAIRATGTPRRDVILLFTDGEELGLEGARAFFAADPLRRRIGIAINLDARGVGGRVGLFETSPGNGAMMRLMAGAVPYPSAASIAPLIYRLMPNSTDLTVALDHGVAGYNLAPQGRADLYHSPAATAGATDRATLDDMGRQVVPLARALAFADRLPARGGDAVFGDLLGDGLLVYPPWAGWLLLGATGGLFVLALVRARPGLRGLARGAMTALWLGSHGALLLMLLNLASGAGTDDRNYYDRLAALPRLELQAALAGLAAIGAAILVSRPLWPTPRWTGLLPAVLLAGPCLILGGSPAEVGLLAATALAAGGFVERTSLWEGWLGALLFVGLLAIALQVSLPGAAPLLAWPLLPASAAAAIAGWSDPSLDRGVGTAAAIAAVAIGGGQTLALAHMIFLSIGIDHAEVMAPILLVLLMLLRPLVMLPPRALLIGSAALGLVAAGIAVSVLVDPLAPTVASYSRPEALQRLCRDDLCRAIR